MVLEATMICIDNSEWMRNEDYSPSRFLAQTDAMNIVCGVKTQQNPENTVGVLTTAGKGARVRTTLTTDLGKILTSTHGIELGGEINIGGAIQIAQLALKHRQNKNQQQRIVVFAGSPVKDDKKALEVIGKKLKKNSVALDVVNFGGEYEENSEKLDALVAAVDNNGTSHVVHVAPGQNLCDVLLSSSVLTDNEGGGELPAAAVAGGIGGASGYEFGVDPNIDPELALALRISMEEERARQEAADARRAAAEEEAVKQGKEEGKAADVDVDVDMVGDDALLMQALAMSMGNDGSGSSAVDDAEMSEARDADRELALALQMSMANGASSAAGDESKELEDHQTPPSFQTFLESLAGVDPNDPSALLAAMKKQLEKDEQDQSNDQK